MIFPGMMGKGMMECPNCNSDNPVDMRFCGYCGALLSLERGPSAEQTRTVNISSLDFPAGALPADRYELLEKLGRGGMGVVYKARDLKLNRNIAIKFLPPESTGDHAARKRFIQEAQTASILDHQNICTIHEVDETKGGRIYIAMAYYAGETLKERLKQGQIPVKTAVEYSIQICRGLHKAHTRKIIHRDIKPANIIITADDVIKILDFGLAKYSELGDPTRTDGIMGTVGYMPPELINGKEPDVRSDIWSTGITLYEMFTGQRPFTGNNEAEVIDAVIHRSFLSPREVRSDIPVKLEQILLKSLQKKPENRFQTIQTLLDALLNLIKELNIDKVAAKSGAEEAEILKKEMERRQATVTNIELVGCSEIIKGKNEEDALFIISRCFEILNATTRKYGGRIRKISNNNYMALYGIPSAIEDAPKNAINAAIEMRNRLHDFRRKDALLTVLDIRIGINTGTVIAGALGTGKDKEYSVMGETVQIAALLQETAPKGRIYAGPMTYRFTRNYFEYAPIKSLALEDEDKIIPVYELLAKKEKLYRENIGKDRMIDSEMVGREKDLAKLELYLLKAVNNEGSIISVIGEAGVGKSRLVKEFKNKESISKFKVLEGRALSIGKNFSFHPIVDFIKNWSGINEDDPPREARQKLLRLIRSIDSEEEAEIFPFIVTLMGMKLPEKYRDRLAGIEGESLEKLILKSLKDLISKASQMQPLLFILEDLHWADVSSIEMLLSLFRLAENYSILFVNVFRPNFPDTGERLQNTVKTRYSGFCDEINLESLNEKESVALINNLLKIKELPVRIRELINRRTEGNPFFIEEVIRSFIDEGLVEIKNGEFRVTDRIDSVVIPETIHEVLMTRIDKLDPGSQALLKTASVIGRSFFYSILAEIKGNTKDLKLKLNLLKEAQLIKEHKRMGELEFLFKHSLARDTIYDSILFKTRKELHLKVALAIEKVFTDRIREFYGVLAYHCSIAEELNRAEKYMLKAGEEALKSSASSEALHYYQEALRIYLKKHGDAADPEKVTALEKNIALALFNRGQYLSADEYFGKVLAFFGEKIPRHSASFFLKFIFGLSIFITALYFPFLVKKRKSTKKDSEVINLLYKKNTALIVIDPKKMFMESFFWLRRLIYFDINSIDNGVNILSMSSAAFSYPGISFAFSRKVLNFMQDKVDRTDMKSLLYYELPNTLLNSLSGNWSEAGEYNEDLVRENLKIGEMFYTTSYIMTCGGMSVEKGQAEKTAGFARAIFDIADKYEHEYAWAAYFWFNTQFLMKWRRIKEAKLEADKGIDYTRKTGFSPFCFSLQAFRARIHVFQGEYDEAAQILEYLSEYKTDINLTPYQISTFLICRFMLDIRLMETALNRRDQVEFKRLQKHTRQSQRKTLRMQKKTHTDKMETLYLTGTYFWLSSKYKKAFAWWERAIALGKKLQADLELSRTYMEIGRRLLETSSRYDKLGRVSADQYLDKADDMFRKMDLQWDLEQLGRIRDISR